VTTCANGSPGPYPSCPLTPPPPVCSTPTSPKPADFGVNTCAPKPKDWEGDPGYWSMYIYYWNVGGCSWETAEVWIPC
jgi:hypothetical protein